MDEDFTINPEIRNLFNQISEHIRSRMKLIVALFIIGIAIGIPISHRIVDWLLDAGLVPDDVNIIILTPVEFIMLQVRVGAWLGAGLAIFALIIDGSWKSGLAKKKSNSCTECCRLNNYLDMLGYIRNNLFLESVNSNVAGISCKRRTSSRPLH